MGEVIRTTEHFCKCGCGKETTIIKHTINKEGKKKGEYNKFLPYHHLKVLIKTEVHKKRIGLSNFKRGIMMMKGYVYIYVKNHPHSKKYGVTEYYPLHRLVMENHLKRYLKPKEVVHHVDNNPLNNKISNLILLPNQKSHAKLHYILNNLKGINKLKGGILR